MMRKIAIRNGYSRGPQCSINQPVRTPRKRTMINPNITGPRYRNPVTIRFASPPNMGWTRPYISVPRRHTVMHIDIMNNDVANILNRNAPAAGDVYVGAAAVDGLVTVDNELVFELDEHVGGKDDP